MIHPFATIGRGWRKRRLGKSPEERTSKVIAECKSGHDLTSKDVIGGTCPVPGCPTPNLFPDEREHQPDQKEVPGAPTDL
jgi:hypothetical protein